MKIFLVTIAVFSALMVAEVHADPGFCDCFGGMSEDGTYWSLLDNNGDPLENGNWVYAAWVGPDGEIDPPQADGYPGGDDLLLPLSVNHMEYSSFLITVTSWQPGSLDSTGVQLRPTDEDLIYCRIFNGPNVPGVGEMVHYFLAVLHLRMTPVLKGFRTALGEFGQVFPACFAFR